MGGFLFGFAVVIAISVLVDWITLLATKKNMNCINSILLAFIIYFLWIVIATGGIVR